MKSSLNSRMSGTLPWLMVSTVVGLLLLFSFPVFAQTEETPATTSILPQSGQIVQLEVPIGEVTELRGLEQYISVVYQFIISAIAILSAVMMMFNGMRWATAGGNSESVGVAKDGFVSALIGLLIALMSYVLLNAINPALVNFSFDIPSFVPAEIPANSSGSASGQYTIAKCDLNESAVTEHTSTIHYCSNAALPIGGSMTKAEVATALKAYEGNLNIPFMGAILTTESAYCSNAQSTFYRKDNDRKGDYNCDENGRNCTATTRGTGTHRIGHACGVIQMLPETARGLAAGCGLTLAADDLAGYWSSGDDLACQQIANEPAKALCMKAKYLNTAFSQNNKSEVYTAAAYNGGQAANRPSQTCQGVTVWECEQNAGYEETRKYVRKVDMYKRLICKNLGGTVIEPGSAEEEAFDLRNNPEYTCYDTSNGQRCERDAPGFDGNF